MEGRMHYIVLLFALIFSSSAIAAQIDGFQNIPFGSSYEQTLSILKEKYGDLVQQQQDEANYIWIHNFDMGQTKSTVALSFDHKGRFYSFIMRLPNETAAEFDGQL